MSETIGSSGTTTPPVNPWTGSSTKSRIFEDIGVMIPQVFLPRQDVDLTRWAVVACDQYTSQPDYWEAVDNIVGAAPSTLRLTLPEIHLGKPEEPELIGSIQASMRQYLQAGLLEPQEGLIYVERYVEHKTRKGLVLCLDLEKYDYQKGSQSLIRATEGTIVERLPPRMKIREGASLELPHILVLIDDPKQTVIEPLAKQLSDTERLAKVYDFELMMNSGHLRGYRVIDPLVEAQVIHALRELAKPANFAARYGIDPKQSVLLFAMGDGNHSLATAKAVWENMKSQVGMNHPARFALVEIENVHDEGLVFEPIHRILFGLKTDMRTALENFYGNRLVYKPTQNSQEMEKLVEAATGEVQAFGLVMDKSYEVVEMHQPATNLAVGTLQNFLDSFMKAGGAEKIDYLHGNDVLYNLAAQPGSAGFYLPKMDKRELFKTVILDGALPRKTFSMGEAHEKRFYVESRLIA